MLSSHYIPVCQAKALCTHVMNEQSRELMLFGNYLLFFFLNQRNLLIYSTQIYQVLATADYFLVFKPNMTIYKINSKRISGS